MHPIEAGLPPLIEVLDEVGSSVAFDERWSVLQRELLDDADLAPRCLRALDAGVTLRDLRSLMKAFGSDWDLVEDRVVADTTSVPAPDLDALADEATLLALRAAECRDPGRQVPARPDRVRRLGRRRLRAAPTTPSGSP